MHGFYDIVNKKLKPVEPIHREIFKELETNYWPEIEIE